MVKLLETGEVITKVSRSKSGWTECEMDIIDGNKNPSKAKWTKCDCEVVNSKIETLG